MRYVTLNPSGRKLEHSHARQRMQHGAHHIHSLGERALTEFLIAIADNLNAAPAILAELEAWNRLDPATLTAVNDRYCGGRQFAPMLSQVLA